MPRWRGVALCLGSLGAFDAHALALGEIEIHSFLNEPLVATVKARPSLNERVVNGCITLTLPPGSDGREIGINYLRDADIEVAPGTDGITLTIRSRNRVVDPVLGLVLRVDCEGGGTMLREYTALLDPRLPRGVQAAYARSATASRPTVTARPAAAPSSGLWRVRSGETLSRITASLAPGDRREQGRLLTAIIAANPDVFPDGDPNRLPAGALLKIPGTTDITGREMPPIARQRTPARTPVPLSARAPSGSAGGEVAPTPRLTLTNSEQVSDLQSADETARMVAESRRLLMETEAQYADAEALKARLRRLENQIALLERTLKLTERAAALSVQAPAVDVSGEASAGGDRQGTAVAMVAPTAAQPAAQPALEVATSTTVPQVQSEAVSRDRWWWLGVLLLAGVVVLVWRLRRRPEAGREEELVDWQLDQLVPEPIGASSMTGSGALEAAAPNLAHQETVFHEDPLADLPEEGEQHDAPVSPDEVPTLDHELTQQMEPQELLLEDFDFEERDTAAKPEVGNVLVRAEFFLLLRQPENAVKLLRETIEDGEPLNREPALWLMLLRIHRQERQRESFEKLREEFNRLFNIAVPDWEGAAKSAADATLERDYPRILDRIVKLWDSQFCEEFLNSLLRDDRDGTRRGFDIDIAEELLLLKGIWRIRSAH